LSISPTGFAAGDRAKAVAVFYAAMPLSYVIGSPLAGVLLGLSWLGCAAGDGFSSSKESPPFCWASSLCFI